MVIRMDLININKASRTAIPLIKKAKISHLDQISCKGRKLTSGHSKHL